MVVPTRFKESYHVSLKILISEARRRNTGSNMKCPKKHMNFKLWKVILSCDGICNFILKNPKIEEFHFWFLFCFKTDHVLLEMPHFPLSESELSNIRKWGISKTNTWSILKQGTESSSILAISEINWKHSIAVQT